MTAIALDHLTLSLGGRDVLSDVSLTIAEGMFVGVLGANGAGKTTLIKALLGLLPPRQGTIRVLGQPASQRPDGIGYMPQSRASLGQSPLRGWDLVAGSLHGHRWGVPTLTAGDRHAVDHALDLVHARDLAQQPLHTLSGGQRQRLLLAQTLLGKPRLLLLDEPLLSLDPHQQETVVGLVRRVQQELALTVLFCAHEINPLLPALDQVLYLGNGQAALGSVAEVITGPVLSRLYGTNIEVFTLNGRLFVMAGDHAVETDHHHHV